MCVFLPGQQRGLVVVSVGKLNVVSDMYGNGGGVSLDEPVHQRLRRDLGRRSPAAGGHQLVWRRHDGAAENTQHFSLLCIRKLKAGKWKRKRGRGCQYKENAAGHYRNYMISLNFLMVILII